MPSASCGSSVQPRVYVYNLPRSVLPRPIGWRLVNELGFMIQESPHNERDGECADYFFVPMHPDNLVQGRVTGDASVARVFQYIRMTWPYFNRSVAEGRARHFWLLPCDHGPGDCAYDRPVYPDKWSPGVMSKADQNRKNQVRGFLNPSDADWIRSTWGSEWELLNPASPSRLVFFLVYNGWADQLRTGSGHCRNCFLHGLDIRMPTPEGHECGPWCGMHHKLPITIKRQLLATQANVGPLAATRRRQRAQGLPCADLGCQAQRGQGALGNCTFYWAGAVRFGNNQDRLALFKHMRQPNVCVRNTACSEPVHRGACGGGDRTMPPGNWSMQQAMSTARFCYSPKGWDMGDSDRYLPSVLYGCVPVMSDKLEAMPLHEHPDVAWADAALAVEKEQLPRLSQLIHRVERATEVGMRASGRAFWQRLLYTRNYFGHRYVWTPQERGPGMKRICNWRTCCGGCSPSATAECFRNEAEVARAKANPWKTLGEQAFLRSAGKELQAEGVFGFGNGTALPRQPRAAAEAVCAAQRSYLGEDGSSDAFATLMAILRQRLAQRAAPLEPWACQSGYRVEGFSTEGLRSHGDGTASVRVRSEARCRPALDWMWFARRHSWYQQHLGAAAADNLGEQALRILPVVRVAAANRRRTDMRPWRDDELNQSDWNKGPRPARRPAGLTASSGLNKRRLSRPSPPFAALRRGVVDYKGVVGQPI